MTKITIGTRNTDTTIEVKINQDLFTCMIPAILAAMPAFINAYMSCLAGDGSADKFKPGNRKRCG